MAEDRARDSAKRPTRKEVLRGRTLLTRIGERKWHWSEAYHSILTLSWPRFFALMFGIYLFVNLVFATAYYLIPGTILNARSNGFLDAFFFSIETLATVGYGVMSPATTYGHVVASTEILLGMLVTAMLTGLLFARFSRPTARVLFSRVAVITTFNGNPTLMLRAGNERNNLILEASVRMSLIRKEKTLEGEVFYRVYDLKLDRERSSAFALSWTVMHRIDESSPLHGKRPADLVADESTLSVAISGLDETLNDTVHARNSYEPEDIVFGSHFVDILFERETGRWSVDFTKFHDVEADEMRYMGRK
jgi:inward rectifier potassium channel